ncbi:MAG: energy transducer TonB, partial [Planctomycetota bacterium]
MSWFEHLLSSELIYRMGCALLGSLWQGVLVALLLAGALSVIPRTKSSARYWCGCIALFVLPVLFCATAVLVGQRAGAMPTIASETTTVAMDGTITEKIDSSTSAGGAGRIDEPAVPASADIEPAKVPASATPWYSRLSDTVKPWSGHIVLCWFVGVFAMSVWNLGGWIAVQRLRCIGISTAPERFVAMLSELARRLGVKHPVRLLQSAVVQSPMTIGWLKPVILVPASILCELSPEQIETILAHELAHIRRFDYLVNLLQTVVETLLFHHPAVWWISHKIRSER